MGERFLGVDMGAESLKLVELTRVGPRLEWTRRVRVEHHKQPQAALRRLLEAWEWTGARSAACTGRLSRSLHFTHVPLRLALASGFRFLHGEAPATVVSIGNHGFSVLELRGSGLEVFRENTRCSQGTGNFLRQLVERFDLTLEQADALCEAVDQPAPLSGRCPVILKTDMTHLANKGESRARILAGLYDAVCENVEVLIKPRLCPDRVAVVGGPTRSKRIREHFSRILSSQGLKTLDLEPEEGLFLEALGAAAVAASRGEPLPSSEDLFVEEQVANLETLPSLRSHAQRVRRLSAPPSQLPQKSPLVLGFDIGSTGSKAVATTLVASGVVWSAYLNTNGQPVTAAKALMQRFVDSKLGDWPVVALGVTGSGREVVGSLMETCFGSGAVYVLNEIAAHAHGALHFEPRVDTIFEIGGQDAKYIRLSDAKVVDAAMNEACSAGTGSFIEEQGRKFAGIRDVVQLGEEAMKASFGVSLGQHCSVFMAEIIDEAVAAHTEAGAIIAGIYDAVVQNYLNRVKGARSVGQVIFCQGMPFASEALAAAVARQTGAEVIIPPEPGLMGALGIALLTSAELDVTSPLPVNRFLSAQVERKDTFICGATSGCGEPGNRCRIDRLHTVIDGTKQKFTWGGSCSLYDRGTRRRKLPDHTPDPFRERELLISRLMGHVSRSRGGPTVALTDEFALKALFPFFATFLYELGLDLVVKTGADQGALKRGIAEANVPFCAPMQQYHGLVSQLSDVSTDFLFLPMVRTLPKAGEEKESKVCPIVQGSPDMLRWDLGRRAKARLITTVIDVGPGNLSSSDFIRSCQRLAADFGLPAVAWRKAYQRALRAQLAFDTRLLEIGRQALAFCVAKEVIPVVVLGRVYTLHNSVLNSNVPALLREQGALPIPVDCYPLQDDVPVFPDLYWGYAQTNLRAAHQIRRRAGHYSVYCSNYSCGPDSFSLHFYAYIMEGKPYAVIETDGHSGDAGTRTRLEAFLYCVQQDRLGASPETVPHSFSRVEEGRNGLPEIIRSGATVLIPRMGEGANVLASTLRGIGVPAEALPMPSQDSLRLGRRYTSGKECVPATLTVGSLLERLGQGDPPGTAYSFFMPSALGPCRFGAYHMLDRLILDRLGHGDKVTLWSPSDGGYFAGTPPGFAALTFAGFMAADLLLEAYHYSRPVEREPGLTKALYQSYASELWNHLEQQARGDLSIPTLLMQVAGGQLFGLTGLLSRAGKAFHDVSFQRFVPTVVMVGEIYVRCDPFANDFTIEKLLERGIRVRFAPFTEWLEYTDQLSLETGRRRGMGAHLSSFIQRQIQDQTYDSLGSTLGWPERTRISDALEAAASYVRSDLRGEAVLTVGGPVHEWREGHIDGVVSVGPLECMPNKIAEAQFFHVAEVEGLLSLTLSTNGDPIDSSQLEHFAYAVLERFEKRKRLDAASEASLFVRAHKALRTLLRSGRRLIPSPLRLPSSASRPADLSADEFEV